MRIESIDGGGVSRVAFDSHRENDHPTIPSNDQAADAVVDLPANDDLTSPPDPLFSPQQGASSRMPAEWTLTSAEALSPPEEAAKNRMNANEQLTPLPADPDVIDRIRLQYRLAKSAEGARIVIDQKLVSFVRVYLTSWTPDDEELARKKAQRVIDTVRKGLEAKEEDRELCAVVGLMVIEMEPTRRAFDQERKARRKDAEKLVASLPAWNRVKHIRGFSAWGMAVLIGEAGSFSTYSGCRKVFKRLGLAPDACYEKGEKSTGRKIPRNSRGRVMGVIADALLRAQWRGEREDAPAHPIGPYGKVYGDTKLRHLETKTKGHADKVARRAMVKALIHDVWRGWYGLDLTYTADDSP
jgi:hypothetical protein